jgi:hypothetical protein
MGAGSSEAAFFFLGKITLSIWNGWSQPDALDHTLFNATLKVKPWLGAGRD